MAGMEIETTPGQRPEGLFVNPRRRVGGFDFDRLDDVTQEALREELLRRGDGIANS